MVDQKVHSAPLIRSVISDRAIIKLNCDEATARRLAEALRTGMRPPGGAPSKEPRK